MGDLDELRRVIVELISAVRELKLEMVEFRLLVVREENRQVRSGKAPQEGHG